MRPRDPVEHLYGLARARLAALGLHGSFTMRQLHREIESVRARQVHLIPKDLPVLAPHGLWIAGERADYVFFDRTAGAIRQHQIIGHEFGHMLFDDETVPARPAELAALIRPGCAPELAVRVQARTSYRDPVERRAEIFGTVAVQRMDLWLLAREPSAIDAGLHTRLSATLVPAEHPC